MAAALDGRVALVTGAARGIGRAIAAEIAAQGGRVALVDIDGDAGRRSAAQIGPSARFIHCDVADEAAVAAAVTEAVSAFGKLDGLINNAGINANGPLEQLSLADWNRVLAVNLTSVFLFARAAAPHLKASAHGAIVNIASTRAGMSEPDTEAYSASKGGIVALTHALAMSLAPVRVNCISPGWIFTKGPVPTAGEHAFHPAGRVGRPEDVASLACWLLSDAAGFATGVDYPLDGGVSRKMIYPE